MASSRCNYNQAISDLSKKVESLQRENIALRRQQKTIVAVIPTPIDMQSQSEAETNPSKEITRATRDKPNNEGVPELREGRLPNRQLQGRGIVDELRPQLLPAREVTLECPDNGAFEVGGGALSHAVNENAPNVFVYARQYRNHRKLFDSRPFVTSTSLSSIHHTSSSCDEMDHQKRPPFKNRHPPRLSRGKTSSPKKAKAVNSGIKSVQDILESSSNGSHLGSKNKLAAHVPETFFQVIDKEMLKLAREVDKGNGPTSNEDFHRSIEKLDAVSGLLSQMVQNVKL